VAKKEKKRRHKSGGSLSGLRGGIKSFVGASGSQKKKESTLSKIVSYLLLAIAVGLLIYRFSR
jgi:hypothetical protein